MRDWLSIFQRMGLRGPAKREIHARNIEPAVLTELREKTMSGTGSLPSNTYLHNAKFVVFDLETTGFDPYGGDEIISISAVTVENGHIDKVSVFDHLVNPYREISPTVTELTGISNEMAKNSPSVLWVLNEFLSFAEGSILVAHHASFDLSFINLKLKQFCQTSITQPVIDTFILSKAILTQEENHTLDSLIQFYKLSPAGRHTSLGDAVIAAEILVKMFAQLSSRGVDTIQELNNYCYWSHNV